MRRRRGNSRICPAWRLLVVEAGRVLAEQYGRLVSGGVWLRGRRDGEREGHAAARQRHERAQVTIAAVARRALAGRAAACSAHRSRTQARAGHMYLGCTPGGSVMYRDLR
jgi:hypothetical protein